MLVRDDASALPTVSEHAMNQVVVSADASQTDWDEYVDGHPEATGCHSWPWRHVYENVFRHPCEYLAGRRDGRISGVLPLVKFRSRLFGRFLISLPFVNDGGVLASDAATRAALLERARQVAGEFRATHVELRHRGRQLPNLPYRQHKVGMRMALPARVEDMWNGLDRKVRNQVRKAQKSGLETTSGESSLVDEFYPVFAANMRDLGTPVYSRDLFVEVLRQFPGRARIFIVRHAGRPVAGAVACLYRGIFEVPWAASLGEHRHLSPNMQLYWTMIEWAIEHGYGSFDFGRSSPSGGTYQFKQQWGAHADPLHWEYLLLARDTLPDQSPSNPRFNAAIAAWKRLPLWVTTRVGPRIVRNIP